MPFDVINDRYWIDERYDFLTSEPFNHIVIDNFFKPEVAEKLVEEFPDETSPKWIYKYKNPIEDKRTCNQWDSFPEFTYSTFSYLCSSEFVDIIKQITGNDEVVADIGLHGGGWHSHSRAGNLNVHLDYNIHPKMKMQRKFNLIVYMTPNWNSKWGGGLELWSHNEETNKPLRMEKLVENKFNRAVIFDTTQNSWHGLPEKLTCPQGIMRQSFAVYYIRHSDTNILRERALFAPHKEQVNDPEILNLIEKRSDLKKYSEVYRTTE